LGQAKLRKETDPLYGKASKKPRGIILSNQTRTSSSGLKIQNPRLDPQDLRSSLLYWDQLAWPSNRHIYFPPGIDEQYLIDIKKLQRPDFTDPKGGRVMDMHRQCYIMALAHYENTEPGTWSLGNSNNASLIQEGASPVLNGALFQLYNALPVPSLDVPLAEILEFKQKRTEELLVFRSHFEALAEEIQGSGDSVDALTKKLIEVDGACSNLLKVTREWQLPVKLTTLNASFNFDIGKGISRAAAAWKGTKELGLSETTSTVSAVVAGIQSQFTMKPDISLQPIKKSTSPYRYVYLVERDLN